MSTEIPPISRPCALAYISIAGDILYRESTASCAAGATPTRLFSSCGATVGAAAPARTGVRSSASRLSTAYCGDCTVKLYTTPFVGLSQKAGEVCEVPDVDTSRSLVTSLGLRPRCCSWVRSMFKDTVG